MPYTLQDFLSLFDYSDPAGNGFNVECPSHVDNKPSLSVTDGKKGIVLFCQAGCSTNQICADLGIKVADLFYQPANGSNGTNGANGHTKKKDWTVIATYPYHRPDGSWAYEIRRTVGKDFLYYRKDDVGRWICGHTGGEYWFSANQGTWYQVKPSSKIPANAQRKLFYEGEKCPYRLPELLASDPAQIVFVVEGEKDVERCGKEGLIATCNPLGAGQNKWLDSFCQFFENRTVVNIPDNDPPDSFDPATGKTTKGFQGQRHSRRIHDSLLFNCQSIKSTVMELQGLPVKGDVSDWLDAGHTAAELITLARTAIASAYPPQAPPASPPPVQPSALAQAGQSKIYNTTDMGNAERFVDRFGSELRYCSKLGKDGTWLIWDGTRWQLDERLKIHKMAKRIVPDIYADAQASPYKVDKERFFDWAIKTEALAIRNNMVKDARPSLAIAVDDLDRHVWLLNCKNGTLDLKTGQLRLHAQGDYLSKLVAFDYDKNARCPEWDKFILEVQQGKPEMVSYIQKAIGYTLTGDVSEKCMFVLHGPPDTGKSTFIEMIQILLDEYSTKIQTQTLMFQRDRGIPNDIAKLKGTRFVHASEAEEQERLAESRIKELTGGDTVCGCFKYGEEFHFSPTWTIWLSTNNKPKASGDKALWNRLKMVPFTRIFTKAEQDKKLRAKLIAEMPGILRWAVEGCLLWQKEGLGEPADVTAATGKYKDEQDIIGHFIDQQCELDPDYREMASDLYKTYKQWCQDTGEYSQSQRAFGLKLTERGLASKQGTSGAIKGKIEWAGIRLIPAQNTMRF